MLKILHTADWHVGRSFGLFEPEAARKLARDRVTVIDRILGLADQYDVDAVLCAGDLFDTPDPGETWWRAIADAFGRRIGRPRPVFLLPGNHDPLTTDSVYDSRHPFRRAVPDWVRVVDRDDFQHELAAQNAVIYAAPCRSSAGDSDLALGLPSREEGDTRVRIGLLHGSTFDIEGYQTNFPISGDAPRQRGLDYLAIGDTHSFREIPEGGVAPIVYPSTPEPTSFREKEAGYVALVWFKRYGAKPRIRRERVARWKWQEATVRNLAELRALAAEDLVSTVLRLKLEMTVSFAEMEETDRILAALKGTDAVNARTGAFVCDRSNLRMRTGDDFPVDGLPASIREATAQLQEEAKTSPESQRALVVLQRLLHEVR